MMASSPAPRPPARPGRRTAALALALAMGLGLGLATPLHAATPSPPVATPIAADGPNAHHSREQVLSRRLANGLDVIIIPDRAQPIVTLELAVKNGAFTETAELDGLSHLYEHMFFKGNAVIPNQEAYLKRMRELGISFNGTTSSERVNYFFTLPSRNLRAGMAFMYDATVSPNFDPAEFEKEKQVVIGELDRAEASPYFWLGKAMDELLWHAYPSRKNVIGSRETLLAATVAQMQTMKATYYVPNNSALLIAGDVAPDEAFRLAEEMFGPWAKGPDPFAIAPIPAHPALAADTATVVERPLQVAAVQLAWHGPSVNSDRDATYAADVLSYILSQPTSRFQKRLVESGLALGAEMGYQTLGHTGPIYAMAQFAPERWREVTQALLEEIEAMQTPDYFTDEQLQSAKTILRAQAIFERQQTSEFAHTVSYWWAVADLDYHHTYLDRLQAVTREEIARYVAGYVAQKPMAAGLLMSPASAKEHGATKEELLKVVGGRSR